MRGYEVLRKLADGSAAEVFLARDGNSQGRVVIEVIRPEVARDLQAYGRFVAEARQRQGLSHPNLLRRCSTGCAPDGRVFVVTEPIGGEHLGSWLVANGPLTAAETVRLMLPLCDALEYLHARGLVHGHLRPSHVFLSGPASAPSPKLLDTGLSLFRSDASVRTPASLVLVEPEYLCPERIKGARADALSDVYGLGVLMFEMLSGQPPFTAADPLETRRRHLAEPQPKLPEGARRLEGIVHRCLSKEPARRFPTVAALKQALAWHAGDAPMAAPPSDVAVGPQLKAEPAEGLVVGEPVGEVLGSYELEDLLGKGGMGRVFLARHTKLGRKVAIKLLRSELARDPVHLKRFFQEARAVNRINHQNIVEIYDFVEEPKEDGGRVYCVMEPLAGRTLREVMKREALPIARGVRIIRQVCGALEAAHRVGVVHRDVKPDNIFLVVREGQPDFVKVLDFGVAKLQAGADESVHSTRQGVVVGTPAYMAPEQALGAPVDHRADIYSLGTVLYAMLSGQLPFGGVSLGPLLARLVSQPPPPLPPRTPAGELIPPELAALVRRCLAKRPPDRVTSMAELSVALAPFACEIAPEPVGDEEILEAELIPDTPPERSVVVEARARPAAPTRWRTALFLAALAAGGFAAAWLLTAL